MNLVFKRAFEIFNSKTGETDFVWAQLDAVKYPNLYIKQMKQDKIETPMQLVTA